MTREYYDREIPPVNRASEAKQEVFWLLRSTVTASISRNLDAIMRACPEVFNAVSAYELYLEQNPQLTFLVFKPEDLQTTASAGERLGVK